MTRNVVTPALTSVARLVPRSANLKYVAIAPPPWPSGTGRSGTERSWTSSTWFVPPCPHRAPSHLWRARTAPRVARIDPSVDPPPQPPAPHRTGVPDRLLVLVGVEAEQLHLDEIGCV